MALAVDGSTPAQAHSSTSATNSIATTASFTPPSGANLLAMVQSDTGGGVPGITFTDSLGTHLTWSEWVVNNTVSIWISSPIITSTSMTVSAATDGGGTANLAICLQVVVLTGANATTVGHTGTASEGNSTFALTYAATAIGSMGFLVYLDGFGVTPAPTVGASGDTVVSSFAFSSPNSVITVANVRETVVSTSVGQTITVGLGDGKTVASDVAYLEILAATATATLPSPIRQSRQAVKRAAYY